MLCNIREFLQFFSTMTSLCRHLSVVSTGNCKWVTTADGCVHTGDTTQLDSFVASRRRRWCVLDNTRPLRRSVRARKSLAQLTQTCTTQTVVRDTTQLRTHHCHHVTDKANVESEVFCLLYSRVAKINLLTNQFDIDH